MSYNGGQGGGFPGNQGHPHQAYYQGQQQQQPQQGYSQYGAYAPSPQQQYAGYPPPQPQGYPPSYPPQQMQQQWAQPGAGPSTYPPPSGPQPHMANFGSNYDPRLGARWQPSTCTGKKKALLIGINYFGQRGQLRGCINDVKNMSNFLVERFGYKREDMVILTDDQQNPRSIPTKVNILQAMQWLVRDADVNDSLFFHYSGHGGQAKDLDGDEGDGYDETIYPVDFRVAGYIVDDEMHQIMVAPLKAGVRLTAIFDSCHSGSALDLPYLYSTQGTLKEANLLRDTGEGLIDVLGHYSRGDVGSVLSTGLGLIKKATTGRKAEEKAKKIKASPADVIQWSGSKDTQKSADTTEGGQATGAMSHAFISALTKNPQQSYHQLLNSIRTELSGKYAQKPQLSCSHPLGMPENQSLESYVPMMQRDESSTSLPNLQSNLSAQYYSSPDESLTLPPIYYTQEQLLFSQNPYPSGESSSSAQARLNATEEGSFSASLGRLDDALPNQKHDTQGADRSPPRSPPR